jgi:hypothetical protein
MRVMPERLKCVACYRAVLPVPFKKKARAVFPSSEVVCTACRLSAVMRKLPGGQARDEHSNQDQHHRAISARRRAKVFLLLAQGYSVATVLSVLDRPLSQ